MRKKIMKLNKKYSRGVGNNRGDKIFYFLLSFILTYGTAFISGIIAGNGSGGYQNLQRPDFSPPAIVFPIVWNILFALMAYSVYRIWKDIKIKPQNKKAVKLYFIGLALNFLWSPLFFGLRLRFIAFIELLILLVVIILTIIEFYKRDKISAALFVPYFLWVSFAGVLNFTIWYLNA